MAQGVELNAVELDLARIQARQAPVRPALSALRPRTPQGALCSPGLVGMPGHRRAGRSTQCLKAVWLIAIELCVGQPRSNLMPASSPVWRDEGAFWTGLDRVN